MENLFKYATKELSQDAFLRWLFESYNSSDKDVKEASRNLLLQFINEGISNYEQDDIVELWTKAQDHKADISVLVKMNDGKAYGIIIEDKTYSNEHNQLIRYKDIFDKDRWWKENTNGMIYIFYKTSFIKQWEIDTVKNARWTLYDLDRIYEYWKKYSTSNNILLKWYSEHIKKMLELYNNEEFVYETYPKYNAYGWFGFFNNVLKKKFEKDYKVYVEYSSYGYTYITFRPIMPIAEEDGTPCLELRSRDCNDSTNKKIILVTRLLTYGMEEKYEVDSINNYKKALLESLMQMKNSILITDKKLNKQLAHTKPIEIKNKEEFVDELGEILYELKNINENAKLQELNLKTLK